MNLMFSRGLRLIVEGKRCFQEVSKCGFAAQFILIINMFFQFLSSVLVARRLRKCMFFSLLEFRSSARREWRWRVSSPAYSLKRWGSHGRSREQQVWKNTPALHKCSESLEAHSRLWDCTRFWLRNGVVRRGTGVRWHTKRRFAIIRQSHLSAVLLRDCNCVSKVHEIHLLKHLKRGKKDIFSTEM